MTWKNGKRDCNKDCSGGKVGDEIEFKCFKPIRRRGMKFRYTYSMQESEGGKNRDGDFTGRHPISNGFTSESNSPLFISFDSSLLGTLILSSISSNLVIILSGEYNQRVTLVHCSIVLLEFELPCCVRIRWPAF